MRDTLSFALVERRQSLPCSIRNPCALCLARRRSDMLEPVSWPSKWRTMGSKKTSSLKRSSSSYASGAELVGGGEVLTSMTSFLMPWVASQSARTDQLEPSFVERRRFCHIQLRPSATAFSTPGRCRISIMLCARIDSFHLLWCVLIFSFSRQSRNAWQSVSISMGEP